MSYRDYRSIMGFMFFYFTLLLLNIWAVYYYLHAEIGAIAHAIGLVRVP